MTQAFQFDVGIYERLLALARRVATLSGGSEGIFGRASGGRLHFREHRTYVPGDDPRDLDWNLYLRLGMLLSKQYSREEAPEVMVLLDRSASMGKGDAGKDRCAREFAVGIAAVALHAEAPFTLAILAEGGPVTLGQWRSHRKLQACMRAVESLGAPDGPTHLQTMLHLPAAGGSGRILFLLSDFLVDPLPTAICAALGRGPNSGGLVHVVSSFERDPFLLESGVLADPETGKSSSFRRTRALTSAYHQELLDHAARLREFSGRYGLGFMALSDAEPFESSILQAFLREGARGVS